ncbi:MAG: hypothetical protein QS748_05885 [Candidatus Endonucleobacter bathymodioli]|uniref:Uncharacterized protein n=1 Tax=Candidatus Endonucleibacter bathymodioli TaxID=539814 RepID=A0AA90SMD8_9GAMM|nr:hypothetical protein [Candidatus Endonucleobacter bathymodioli]
MHTIRKMFQQLIFGLSLRAKDVIEFCRVARRYFPRKSFAFSWCYLKYCYLFRNPYQCSRNYRLKQKNFDELLYGETPLTTLEQVTKAANVSARDHVFELGAGSGYTCLWLSCIIGCKVSAIEIVPIFCWHLGRVQKYFSLSLDVRCESFLETDFSDATVIYLYGSALSDQSITQLAKKLAELPKRTKVISISYALSEYIDFSAFKITKQFMARFDWGEAKVFIQEVI